MPSRARDKIHAAPYSDSGPSSSPGVPTASSTVPSRRFIAKSGAPGKKSESDKKTEAGKKTEAAPSDGAAAEKTRPASSEAPAKETQKSPKIPPKNPKETRPAS
jgi:hypothetical protein